MIIYRCQVNHTFVARREKCVFLIRVRKWESIIDERSLDYVVKMKLRVEVRRHFRREDVLCFRVRHRKRFNAFCFDEWKDVWRREGSSSVWCFTRLWSPSHRGQSSPGASLMRVTHWARIQWPQSSHPSPDTSCSEGSRGCGKHANTLQCCKSLSSLYCIRSWVHLLSATYANASTLELHESLQSHTQTTSESVQAEWKKCRYLANWHVLSVSLQEEKILNTKESRKAASPKAKKQLACTELLFLVKSTHIDLLLSSW